ncbi:major facilitator superfamily domain-containing protein [Aspergillus venezuelensis]
MPRFLRSEWCSFTFLFALHNTITTNSQADIVPEFDAISKLTWISVGLVMSAAATVLLWGKIFYQFNTKWSYIISVAIFEVGSAICGAARNMVTLIVGRVLCGIGGSGLYLGVITLLSASTTLHERPMYIVSTGLTWGLGMVLGPLIGGGFSQSLVGWQWAFYINLVFGGAWAPVYLFLIPNIDPCKGASFLDRALGIDYVGSVLNIGAFVSGFMASSFGDVTWAWGSARIIALFIVSGTLLILFGVQQALPLLTTVSRRLVVVDFLKSRTMLILFAATAAARTAAFIPMYIVPLFFQFTRGDYAFDSGVRLLPFIILYIFAIIANGVLMSKFGFYMPWYTFRGVLVLTGGALFYTVDIDTSVARIYGFITCSQVVGSTIALAIANSVFLNKAQREVSKILPDISLREVQTAIPGTGDVLANLSESTRREVEVRIVESMGDTYIFVITAGALTLVLCLLMKRERLFK